MSSFLQMAHDINYMSILWENNKLSKYKALCDFNQNSNIDKNMVIMESLNLNCSEIVGKSSKICDQSSIDQPEDYEKFQIKSDGRGLEDLIEYESKRDNFIQTIPNREGKNNLDNAEASLEPNQEPKPDTDKFNFDINFSIIETVPDKPTIDRQLDDVVIIERKVTIDPEKTPSLNNKYNESGLRIDSHFKTFYQDLSSEKHDNKTNITHVNNSQKSTNTNLSNKTQADNPSKLFSYSFQNLVEKYSKIKEKVNAKKTNAHNSRIKMNFVNHKANSISSIIKKNDLETSTKSVKKNSMIDSYSKYSVLDTFVSTVPLKSSGLTSINVSAQKLKRTVTKSNISFNKSMSKIK